MNAPNSSVRQQIRAATSEAHQALEGVPPLCFLKSPIVTATHVGAAIAGQHALIAPVERRYADVLPSFYAPRGHHMARDMAALGCELPAPAEPLPLEEPAERLGFAYVVEGSAFGSLVLARHFAEHLPQLPALRTYSTVVDVGHRQRWARLVAALDASSPTDAELAIRAARRTFEALHQRMLETAA